MTKIRSTRKPISDINVVPYIDVMLVLLIVFMVTAPLLTQGIKIELPEVQSEPLQQQQEPVVIFVNTLGEYFLNIGEDRDKPLSIEDLQQQLMKVRRSKPNIPILIEGDKNVPYGKVVYLLSTLRSSELTKVGLVTDPEPTHQAEEQVKSEPPG